MIYDYDSSEEGLVRGRGGRARIGLRNGHRCVRGTTGHTDTVALVSGNLVWAWRNSRGWGARWRHFEDLVFSPGKMRVLACFGGCARFFFVCAVSSAHRFT